MSKAIYSILIFSLSISIVMAQETCAGIVTTALELTSDNCEATARNQACYGHSSIDATLRDDGIFEEAGHIIDIASLEALRLSQLDESNGTWGVSLFQVQANLPNTTPGQGIRILLFGDTEIENSVPYFDPLTVTANSNTRLRSSPFSANDFNVLTGISSGTQLIANARTEDGEWLRVGYERSSFVMKGWIAAIVVDGDSERMNLPVADPADATYGPMQAFYFSTGLSDSTCAEVPDNGLLIQTPEGAGSIDFLVNEVSIRLGSTVYLQDVDNNLRVNLLEGEASVGANGVRQFLVPGTFTDVELAEDGRSAIGQPTFPQPYDADVIARLPVDTSTVVDDSTAESDAVLVPVVAEAPPAEGEVESMIAETYGTEYGVAAGWYRVSVIGFEQVVPNQFIDGYCASGGVALGWLYTEEFGNYDFEDTFAVESFTSFTFTGDNSSPDLGGCIVQHRATWTPIGPNGF